jgi:hypothetical protein
LPKLKTFWQWSLASISVIFLPYAASAKSYHLATRFLPLPLITTIVSQLGSKIHILKIWLTTQVAIGSTVDGVISAPFDAAAIKDLIIP